MKTTKSIKQLFIAGLIAIGTYSTAYGQDQQIKTAITGTQIMVPDQKPVSRFEAVMKYGPIKADAYILAEKRDNRNVYKFRFQSLPVSYGPASAGVSVQHVNNGQVSQEIGGVARIQGLLMDEVTGKIDVRYFPQSHTSDWYGIVNTKEIFADVLGSYNTETKSYMIRPGIDYKVTKGIMIGLEGKIIGTPNTIKTDYVGLRLKGTL